MADQPSPIELQKHLGGVEYPASKDALVADAYKRAAADLLAGLREAVEAAPADPRSRLDAFFWESFSARVLDPKLLKVWTSFWILADRSPHVQAAHERNNLQYRELLERLLLELAAEAPAPVQLRLAAIGLSACKKDEVQATLTPTNTVTLTASTTNVVLTQANASSTAATVSPSTRPIQNPVASIGTRGDHGNQPGASPRIQPAGRAARRSAISVS